MKKGFTLIELLSVIVVIAIISIIAVPALTGVINKARLNALKDSAYGLIEASNFYYAQYQNSNNIRFDINNNKVVSSDTTNSLKYKGTIKEGVSIIKNNGQTVVCVTDGKNSAYKNYNESNVSLASGKVCTIPSSTSIVYLDGNATLDELSNQELTNELKELQNQISDLKKQLNSKASNSDVEELTNVTSDLQTQINSKTAVDKTYPVGSIYMSVSNTNPSTLFGGTWVKIEGRFLLGSSSSYTLGATGGNTSVSYTPQGSVGNTTLTINQIPSHNHSFSTYFVNNPSYVFQINDKNSDYVAGTDNGSPDSAAGYVANKTTNSVGGSQGHNHSFTGTAKSIATMPPYIVVNVWKRTA